jgi:hypothetical protein
MYLDFGSIDVPEIREVNRVFYETLSTAKFK